MSMLQLYAHFFYLKSRVKNVSIGVSVNKHLFTHLKLGEMKKTLLIIAVFLFVSSGFMTAGAVSEIHGKHHKVIRIDRAERIHLNSQKANLKTTVKIAKSDGVITKKECHVIRRKQKRINRSIYRKRHN